jgi:hypothetical protein
MSLTEQFAPGTQVRAAFCSEANFSHWADPRGQELEIGRILHPAPHHEHHDQIGGIFHAGNRYYLQVIEGPVEAVDWYLEQVENDDRHTNVQRLAVMTIDQPVFATGRVRFVGTAGELRDIQQRTGKRVFDPYRYDEEMVEAFVALGKT